jgi:hypothetical protein
MTVDKIRPLLPNEPRQLDWELQERLTKKFLHPVLKELERFLLNLRVQLDPQLSADSPTKANKPYPLGQCLEISLAVKKQLEEISPSQLQGNDAIAFSAIQQFSLNGGVVRQIWGDLRGQYFQNAFLFGDLYVDVSNDTVVATKPKVEILPFKESNLSAIKDFYHFVELAQRYWKAEIFPNHIFPVLAPYVPLLVRFQDGEIQILDSSKYMIMLTTSARFQPSIDFLSNTTLPVEVFASIQTILNDSGLILPESPDEGREQAQLYCEQYSINDAYSNMHQIALAVERTLRVNTYFKMKNRASAIDRGEITEVI